MQERNWEEETETIITIGEYDALLQKHSSMAKAYKAAKQQEEVLKKALEAIKDRCNHAGAYTDGAYAYHIEHKALQEIYGVGKEIQK